MVTGISRFTKGEFSQTALDEVWNKGRETYKDPIPPPSSGVEINSLDRIWEDMLGENTGQPAASSMSYGYVQGPLFIQEIKEDIDYEEGELWARINAWFEVEEGCGSGYQECQLTHNQSTNTRVEVKPMWLMWQDLSGGHFGDGDWHILTDGTGYIGGQEFPGEHGNPEFDKDRGCHVPEVEAIREATKGYSPEQGINDAGNYLYLPNHYWWYHGWTRQQTIDHTQFNAIYACAFVRLVLIDPDGVDDRHLADYVIHLASDKKDENGGTFATGIDTGGRSRYRQILTNGDWMSINWLTGWVDEASLAANPPPFPATP